MTGAGQPVTRGPDTQLCQQCRPILDGDQVTQTYLSKSGGTGEVKRGRKEGAQCGALLSWPQLCGKQLALQSEWDTEAPRRQRQGIGKSLEERETMARQGRVGSEGCEQLIQKWWVSELMLGCKGCCVPE